MEEIQLETTKDMKWLKLGAAAFLSVGMLAGCADGDDVDVINPPGDVDTDDGTDADVDVDVDDDMDDDNNDDGK
jgi:hypothetical protein